MPTRESIQTIHINLNANTASVPSDLGGGAHGHLGLTIGGAEYQTITGHAFARPAPGLWRHTTRDIRFTLVVDDFGVKYTNKED
eukprot:6236891-Ditylum_brightwellii.AAC.1